MPELAASMAVSHYYQSAVLLANGQVLVFGGYGGNGAPTTDSEVYDPATDGGTEVGSLDLRARP